MEGNYKVTWDNGIEYDGMIEDNKLHGEGSMTFNDGNILKIEGVWTNDTLTKCNMLTMRDGSTADNYDPVSGKLRGEGTVKVGASTYTGNWDEEGKLNGPGSIVNDDNQGSFQGAFQNNVRNGAGVYKWPNNQGTYTGNFINGMRDTTGTEAPGKMVWNTDEQEHVYEGQWKNGQCTVGLLDGNQVDQTVQD